MDPQAISQAAHDASQVGLLTWLVVAVALFCGVVVLIVLWQNFKREERYAKLVEDGILNLGKKLEIHTKDIDDRMRNIEEANRMTKKEHELMVITLNKISDTMINLTYLCKKDAQA